MAALAAGHFEAAVVHHDRCWAIASARRDREIVSSARLILVISKRVVISLRICQTLAREPRVS